MWIQKDRGTQDQPVIIRQLAEMAGEKTFDRIGRTEVWKMLKEREVHEELIKTYNKFCVNMKNYVRVKNEKRSDTFLAGI